MKKFISAIAMTAVISSVLLMSGCGAKDAAQTEPAAEPVQEAAATEATEQTDAEPAAEAASEPAVEETSVSEDQAAVDAALPAEEISINYQSSIGYAPLLVMKDQGLIEKNYGGDIKVNWMEMSNGAEVNEALISGNLDVGSMGVPVAVTGIMAGSPYKIAFGLAAQPYAILSSDDSIKTLSDIGDNEIAITNINSQPHILLAMAAKKELGDAHALDANLTKLGNADGYTAMLSGAVKCHMVISPYNFMETTNEEANIHELMIDPSVWPADNTALVSVVPEALKNDKPEVYNAIITAVDEANEFIKANPEQTAEILAQGYDASAEDILTWMTDERSSYSSELKGVMNMANFMVEEGFLDEGPASIDELVYDNVKGE